jgi:hypothetical protein
MAWWVTFIDGTSGCLQGYRPESDSFVKKEEVVYEAANITGKSVKDFWSIPYPANPVLDCREGMCPTFCMFPAGECKGRGSCPRRISCCD